MTRFTLLLLAGLLPASVQALDAADEARYHALIAELRCLVCQNQTIAESNAPLAHDLRAQVAEMIAAGRSDEEILDYMTARYGDFVRYRPPLRGYTLLLWASPLLMVLIGAALLWGIARRRRAIMPANGHVDADALRRELERDDS